MEPYCPVTKFHFSEKKMFIYKEGGDIIIGMFFVIMMTWCYDDCHDDFNVSDNYFDFVGLSI